MRIRTAIAVTALAAALGTLVPARAVVAVIAVPGSRETTYATTRVVVTSDRDLDFVNLDIAPHNVWASTAHRDSGSAAWCGDFAEGSCPLFWTPLIGRGETVRIAGLEDAVVGEDYPFFCSLHPGMTGVITVLDL